MTFPKRLSPARFVSSIAAVAAFVATMGSALSAPGADDGRGVLQMDAQTRRLVPAPELTRDRIYYHYNERLGRRVWTFWYKDKRDGALKFWYPLGEGTTQKAQRLDPSLTQKQALDILKRTNPRLAEALERTDRPAYVRLDAEGRWEVAPEYVTHASVYNAETGQRWEEVCHTVKVPPSKGEKAKGAEEPTTAEAERPKAKFTRHCEWIPVKTLTGGNRWVVRDGRYVPAGVPQW